MHMARPGNPCAVLTIGVGVSKWTGLDSIFGCRSGGARWLYSVGLVCQGEQENVHDLVVQGRAGCLVHDSFGFAIRMRAFPSLVPLGGQWKSPADGLRYVGQYDQS